MVTCKNCGTPATGAQIMISEGCPGCGYAVCMLCGCTDQRACPLGCTWLRPFVCSTHAKALVAEYERVFNVTVSRVATIAG